MIRLGDITKVLHDWGLPHNYSGTGAIIGCPIECPKNDEWRETPLQNKQDEDRRLLFISQGEKS